MQGPHYPLIEGPHYPLIEERLVNIKHYMFLCLVNFFQVNLCSLARLNHGSTPAQMD